MKVLLLVDIQRDFCPGGSLAVPDGHLIVPVVNALLRSGQFDLVIATKDWHPHGHVSFATTHGARVFQELIVSGFGQMMWPDHCVQDTPGAELHPDLDLTRIHRIVQKGTHPAIDSYSAFFDNRRLNETRLRQMLLAEAAARGERLEDVELFVTGLATDVCVRDTVKDARSLNLPVTLVLDGCRALSPEGELATIRELADLNVSIVESRELLVGSRGPLILPPSGRDSGRSIQL